MARREILRYREGSDGKEYAITVAWTEGKMHHRMPDGRELGVDAVSRCDYGERLGESSACTVSQPASEEERTAGRTLLRQTAARMLENREPSAEGVRFLAAGRRIASRIDKNKIELDEGGKVKSGLDEQVKALQESKAFLFIKDEPGHVGGPGPVESDDGDPGALDAAILGAAFGLTE